MLLLVSSIALSDHPVPWQMDFQTPATPTMEKIYSLYYFMLALLGVIFFFVVVLMVYVLVRFRAKVGRVPSLTSHNVWIEILWTAIPVVLLTIIAIPTFKIIYFANEVPEAEFTLKVVGRQWYWTYEYPDHQISFDSYMILDKDLKPGQKRLLDVDNRIMIPQDTVVRIQVTGADVIHSFAVPAFGVKIDAIPGRVNETWIKVKNVGVYYGQCSELCGASHAFMPIAVEVVSRKDFNDWLAMAKTKFANNNYQFISYNVR
jgi:cytochrome c oxidase subunit 2